MDSPEAHTGSVPVPDPTVLTTQQLQREIASSREIIENYIDGIKLVIETRLDGMDKAIEIHEVRHKNIPRLISEKVGQLQHLHEERFRSIGIQFRERDTRVDNMAEENKVSIDVAFQAAKEAVYEQNKSNLMAVAKSELAFTKQVDQIGVLINSLQKSFDDKIDDIKTRLQSIEGQRKGFGEAYGVVISVVTSIIAIITVVFTISRK